MIKSIEFTNFRRFQFFPKMDLGDITILVGGNNAGKSTLVKAMLLIRDFLKSRIEGVAKSKNRRGISDLNPQFSFDTEHVNVGDYYRAFCRNSPQNENTISFMMKIDNFRFEINIRGERKPGIIPKVSMIAVSDEERDIHFYFDFSKGQMKVHFEYNHKALNSENEEAHKILSKIERLKRDLSQSKDLNEISNIKLELEKLERIVSIHDFGAEISEYDEVTIDMIYFNSGNIGELIIPELIRTFSYFAETGTTGNKQSQIYNEKVAQKTFLRGKVSVINAIAEELERILNSQVIEYIYAHSVAQKPFYADCVESISSDYTKRTIHEFYNARISSKDAEYLLIKKWLEEFKIGSNLNVFSYGGDNYRVVIFDRNYPEIKSVAKKGYPGGIDLADKGMGSIQLAVLLLRIATFIRKYRGQQLTILLEEPEQNLHPAMQSKLADLIYEINKEFGIHFVIETHSEYFIRKSQVIVAEASISLNHSKNPFVCYYLPDDGRNPYEMIYREDGNFANEFGEGFFDTATKLLYDIL